MAHVGGREADRQAEGEADAGIGACKRRRTMMAENDAEQNGQDEDRRDEGGLVETLVSQLGQHKEVLAPVATSAAAAAAAYAAKKLPQLIEQLENGGSDKLRGKLDEASDAGGVKGFAAGAAS